MLRRPVPTIDEVRVAAERAAELVMHDEAYLPLFERIDAELAQMEEAEGGSAIDRARARLKARRAA